MIEDKYKTNFFQEDSSRQISTLSHNQKFYYKIKEPTDLYWGLFCCPIAFYDINNNLIYHNSEFDAECSLNEQTETWNIANYSKSGNLVSFVERNSPRTFYFVLIDLLNKGIYRKEYTDIKNYQQFYDTFSKNNFDDQRALTALQGQFESIKTDELKFELKSIFGLTSWRP